MVYLKNVLHVFDEATAKPIQMAVFPVSISCGPTGFDHFHTSPAPGVHQAVGDGPCDLGLNPRKRYMQICRGYRSLVHVIMSSLHLVSCSIEFKHDDCLPGYDLDVVMLEEVFCSPGCAGRRSAGMSDHRQECNVV